MRINSHSELVFNVLSYATRTLEAGDESLLLIMGFLPEEIRAIITWKPSTLRDAQGTLGSRQFGKALAEQLISEGKKPQSTKRYFIEDDELIHANEKTYAVTKMWGNRTAEAMGLLVDRFKDKGVSYHESS